jgi:hypothetical protein
MQSTTEASLQARAAVYTSWAHTADRAARTAPARAAAADRFRREVDPDGVLPEAELHRRVQAARSAYYTRLALAAVRARQRKAR